MTTMTTQQDTTRKLRRRVTGVVQSDGREKTIGVRLDRLVKWPKYGKYVKRRSVVHAHDEKNEAKIGDRVEIAECRPISRTKTWRLVRVLDRGATGVAAS